MPFSMHPGVLAGLIAFGEGRPRPPLPVDDVLNRRARLEDDFTRLAEMDSKASDVETKDFHTTADDGHQLTLRWYTKKGSQPPGSAICYFHGGGMISLGLKHYDHFLEHYVSRTGVPFLSVDYRLAPEVRAPVPVMDAYAGLRYLHSHAAELGVDTNRIGIMGDSAGGGIAASLTHYAKLRGGPQIAKQILIYPMLDDRTDSAHPALVPFLTWTIDDNITGWRALLGDRLGRDDVYLIEAAGRMTAQDARGLPPAYIDIGELDLFRDESLEYARNLGKGGVSVELHLIPNSPHAFDTYVPDVDVTAFVFDLREKVIKGI